MQTDERQTVRHRSQLKDKLSYVTVYERRIT